RLVDIGNFELASGRGLERRGDIEHLVVVEVQAGHRVARFWLLRFLLEAYHFAISVELGHTVSLGVGDRVGEYRRARSACIGVPEHGLELMAVEDVVAEHQCRCIGTDEAAPDDERLSKTVRRRLYCVGKMDAPARAITEELAES